MARSSTSAAAAGLLVVVALVLVVVPPVAGEDSEETVLAESDFLWDVDGWTTRGAAENFQHGQKMIKASDAGPVNWFFVAPGKFLGAKRAAYGGKLSFRHGFFEYNSEGAEFQDKEFDVLLHSDAHGLVLGRRHLVPAWAFRSDHEVDLVETAGWVINGTSTPPSKPDMTRVLSKLSGISIRGGYYKGNEDAYLMAVKMTAGPKDGAAKKTSLKEQRIMSTSNSPVADDTPPPPEGVPPPPEQEL